jgi:S1-C subfamily serine protease
MEELTKQQIVLVTLLVSFITSLTTGIVTVALMDQAPPGVTQTINRVVERTVEKVVPGPTQQAAVITKETVVVKEDDLVVQAIEKNSKSIVSIIKILGEGATADELFAGNGLIVSKDGLIATDASIMAPMLDDNENPIVQSLKVILSDGTILPVKSISTDTSSGIVLLKPTLDDKTKKIAFVPASLTEASSLKLSGRTHNFN